MDKNIISQINTLFRGYKAEWLEDNYSLYEQPEYFDDLESIQPSILVGGRGSGKTTALMGLSYEGRHALSAEKNKDLNKWNYLAIYHRINSTRTSTAGSVNGNPRERFLFFSHYINLVMCQNIAQFVVWYENKILNRQININFTSLAKALKFSATEVASAQDLYDQINEALDSLSDCLNGNNTFSEMKFSVLGKPIDLFFDLLSGLENFKGKRFFYIMDEYENFTKEQQEIVNLLIKHAAPRYIFKIGVREFGLKSKKCWCSEENLEHPADYKEIKIDDQFSESSFREFAVKVAQNRISQIFTNKNIQDIFVDISIDDEAELLANNNNDFYKIVNGVDKLAKKFKSSVIDLKPLNKFIIGYWARENDESLDFLVEKYDDNSGEWLTRFGNYRYQALFLIRKGKSGIKKYYNGIATYSLMSGKNLRNFLELIEAGLKESLKEGDEVNNISPEIQTTAAIVVAVRRFRDIQQRDLNGGTIVSLLNGLGRLFGEASSRLTGFPPEPTSFRTNEAELSGGFDLVSLLNSCVKHSVFIRHVPNKLREHETADGNEYQLHPFFAAFFYYSHRKKRCMDLDAQIFEKLLKDPEKIIRSIIDSRINDSPQNQLKLF